MSDPPPLRAPTGSEPRVSRALGGVWRLTIRRAFSPRQFVVTPVFIVLYALLLLVSIRDGNASGYFQWLTNQYLTILLPVLAFLSGGSLVRDDMSPAIVDYVLTRPVRRPLYLVFRVVSHLLCLQVWCVLVLAALTIVAVFRDIPGALAALPALCFTQLLVTTAFGILGVLAGSLTARYLILGLAYGGIVEVGLGSIPMQVNRLSILHHVRAMVSPLVDNPGHAFGFAAGSLGSLGFVFVLSLVALALAAVLFSMREFAGDRPKEA